MKKIKREFKRSARLFCLSYIHIYIATVLENYTLGPQKRWEFARLLCLKFCICIYKMRIVALWNIGMFYTHAYNSIGMLYSHYCQLFIVQSLHSPWSLTIYYSITIASFSKFLISIHLSKFYRIFISKSF